MSGLKDTGKPVVLTPELEEEYQHSHQLGCQVGNMLLSMFNLNGLSSQPYAIVHAMAHIYSSLLVTYDGLDTLYEKEGLGLVGDEERLDLFKRQVIEMANGLRKQIAEAKAQDKREEEERGKMPPPSLEDILKDEEQDDEDPDLDDDDEPTPGRPIH